MSRTAEQTAQSAELSQTHPPGMCLQWSRQRADIPARYPDASTAWFNVADKHRDRAVPRGAMAYWTGGSKGYGHIAVGLGRGQIRSTDAGGTGIVATKTLPWFDINWPSLHYQGWAYEVNGVTIPHQDEEDEMTPEDWQRLRDIVAEEIAANNPAAADVIWETEMTVTTPDGEKVEKVTRQVLREIWQRLTRHMDTG